MLNDNGASRKYTKLQILEAMQTVITRTEAEKALPTGEFRDAAECLVSDMFDVLDDAPHWAVSNPVEILATPFGFLPVLGEIVADDALGNVIRWYGGDDPAPVLEAA